MVYAITIILIAVALLSMASYMNQVKYASDIRVLSSLQEDYRSKIFHQSMTDGLPYPVQRYLNRVIPEGFPFIEQVHLTHAGRFRNGPDKEWADINGDQYFITSRPGFIWRGKTRLFTADDRYVDDQGSLRVRLFSVFPVVNEQGKYIDEGELQRWMGEHFWFPTNLLNQNLLRWESIDDRSSRLTLRYPGTEIPVVYHFSEDGLIEAVTCKRYSDKDHIRDWKGKVTNYRSVNGLLVPHRVQAIWEYPEADFMYADFRLNSIEYTPDTSVFSHRQKEHSPDQAGIPASQWHD